MCLSQTKFSHTPDNPKPNSKPLSNTNSLSRQIQVPTSSNPTRMFISAKTTQTKFRQPQPHSLNSKQYTHTLFTFIQMFLSAIKLNHLLKQPQIPAPQPVQFGLYQSITPHSIISLNHTKQTTQPEPHHLSTLSAPPLSHT